jgi:hypothetical protein
VFAASQQYVWSQSFRREFRSFDGYGNNRSNEDWGAAGTDLLRLAPAAYWDGVSSLAGQDRKSPREISNIVCAQGDSIPNQYGLTDMVWQWGQFLDHDISSTEHGAEEAPIDVPDNDPVFHGEIPFHRSVFNPYTGNHTDNPRQQPNQISAFIDASNVYGSYPDMAGSLRQGTGGRLKVTVTDKGDLLPEDEFGFFVAGDIRVNEQVYLTAMHTLWMREHNRIADELAAKHRKWTDERIYQHARRKVGALMQAITYNEFIPALLGHNALPRYRGYRKDVHPGIANEFSTGAFRFHTMLSSRLRRVANDGTDKGDLELRQAFFHPQLIRDDGIDHYLMGLASKRCQEIDAKVIDDVRNFLFNPPFPPGFDLVALNIQRGRDHGLPAYNTVRTYYGLEPVAWYDEITRDVRVQMALFEAYEDEEDEEYLGVDNIDFWVGMMAEDPVPGACVGPLAYVVLVDQFVRLRDGDRFWYERNLKGRELREIRTTRLSDVIRRNTNLTNVRQDVFHHCDHHDDDDDDDDD